MTLEPTRRAFLLMAELEETQHGDRGRVREWLARAVRAPADPAWVADGGVSETWAPVSPVDGRLDAFVWTSPPAALDHQDTSLEALDEAMFEALPAVAASIPARPDEIEALDDGPSMEMTRAAPAAEPKAAETPVTVAKVEETAPETASERPVAEVKPVLAPVPAAKPVETAAAAKDPEGKSAAKPAAAPAAPAAAAADAVPVVPAKGDTKPDAKDTKSKDLSRPIEFPLKHMPDDPGPDGGDDEEPPKTPGYRFFN